MNKRTAIITIIILLSSCTGKNDDSKRMALAVVGNKTLYYDEVPRLLYPGISPADSQAVIQNYINSWARKKLLFLKAEENLTDEFREEIERELQETRENLVIYRYQRQMMVEKMDTIITDDEMRSYYAANEKKFNLSSNIVKALFIKVPGDIPALEKIRTLARSSEQSDLQQLESLCFQFAEKFDDFGEGWVTMDRLSVELPQDIPVHEDFLRYNTWYETKDSLSVYMITIRDYRLRYSLAPYDYVRNDIKNIILNSRRFEFLQSLENGIYNDALKVNLFKKF